MAYDDKGFTHQRYLTLLAAKPQGKRDHGRVWTKKDEAFLLTEEGQIRTVTSVAQWLTVTGYLEEGPRRNLGGRFLVPTDSGLRRLEAVLRPASSGQETRELSGR